MCVGVCVCRWVCVCVCMCVCVCVCVKISVGSVKGKVRRSVDAISRGPRVNVVPQCLSTSPPRINGGELPHHLRLTIHCPPARPMTTVGAI